MLTGQQYKLKANIMKYKAKCLLLMIQFTSIQNMAFAKQAKEPAITFVGSFGSDIQLHGESVFDVILEKMFDSKRLAKLQPFKPKKDSEKTILEAINGDLSQYNLNFGDLFIGKFEAENKEIIALVLIYGTLEPRIRYYQLVKKTK